MCLSCAYVQREILLTILVTLSHARSVALGMAQMVGSQIAVVIL